MLQDQHNTTKKYRTHPYCQDQSSLDAGTRRADRHAQDCRGPRAPPAAVEKNLSPADQAEGHEALRLDLDGDVEVLDDAVDAEGHAAHCPEEHHRPGQAVCGLCAPVCPYLRYELDAPQDRAYCPEDRCRDGDGGLWCHGGGGAGEVVFLRFSGLLALEKGEEIRAMACVASQRR